MAEAPIDCRPVSGPNRYLHPAPSLRLVVGRDRGTGATVGYGRGTDERGDGVLTAAGCFPILRSMSLA